MNHFYRLFTLKQRINGYTIMCQEPTSYAKMESVKIFVAKKWSSVLTILMENSGIDYENLDKQEVLDSAGFGKSPTLAMSDDREPTQLIFQDKFENGWLLRFKVKEKPEDTTGYWFEFVAESTEEKDQLIQNFEDGKFRDAIIVGVAPRLAIPFDEEEEDEDYDDY